MTKQFLCITCIIVTTINLGVSVTARGDAVKWDYLLHPVTVTENRPSPDTSLGLCVRLRRLRSVRLESGLHSRVAPAGSRDGAKPAGM